MRFLFSRWQKLPTAILAVFLTFAFFSSVPAQEDGDENANNAIKLFNQGQDAQEKNDFQAAIKLYDEALKLFPEFAEVEFQRGNAFQSLNNLTEAEKSFRRVFGIARRLVASDDEFGRNYWLKKVNLTKPKRF